MPSRHTVATLADQPGRGEEEEPRRTTVAAADLLRVPDLPAHLVAGVVIVVALTGHFGWGIDPAGSS
jgi:hypothetical protein